MQLAVDDQDCAMQFSINVRYGTCQGLVPSGGGCQPLCRWGVNLSLSHQVGGQLCEPLLGVLDIGQSQRSQVLHLPLQEPGLSGRQLPHDACDQPFPCPAQGNQCHFGIGSGEQLGKSAVVKSLDVCKPGSMRCARRRELRGRSNQGRGPVHRWRVVSASRCRLAASLPGGNWRAGISV